MIEAIKAGLFFTILCALLISDYGATGANYLRISAGARPASLGNAFVAQADDTNSLWWNPAGLSRISRLGFETTAINWFEGISGTYFGGVFPQENSVIGCSFLFLSTPQDSETIYDDNSNYLKTSEKFSSGFSIAQFSFARKITEDFSGGINLKYISENLAGNKYFGYSSDIGFQKQNLLTDIDIGFVVQNILGKELHEAERLPLTGRLGFSRHWYIDSRKISLLADAISPIEEKLTYGVGIEYSNKYWAFRMGKNELTGITLGLGLFLGDLSVDYAYVPYIEIGVAHRVSLQYVFGSL